MQAMNKTLTVALAERSYPIHIGVGVMAQAELILPHIKQKQVVVVTNTTVAPLYFELLRSTLEKGEISILPVVLPDAPGAPIGPGPVAATRKWIAVRPDEGREVGHC